MAPGPITIGSRGSALAKAQVRGYIRLVTGRFPAAEFVQRVITEDGDRDRVSPLQRVSERSGGSAFSSAQEAALARGDVDLIVHSLKDVPTSPTPGLPLLPPPAREELRDALCGSTLGGLPPGARVGTGSARRAAQLLAVRPDLEIVPIRGNVPPRLRKLRTMALDAVVLAAAGLLRLGLEDEITELLPLEVFPPSPGQGALGIKIRDDAVELRRLLAAVGDKAVDRQVRAERAMLGQLHGGCSVPVGAYAEMIGGGQLTLFGQVTSLDGTRQLACRRTGPEDAPEELGRALAADLCETGADVLLRDVRDRLAAR